MKSEVTERVWVNGADSDVIANVGAIGALRPPGITGGNTGSKGDESLGIGSDGKPIIPGSPTLSSGNNSDLDIQDLRRPSTATLSRELDAVGRSKPGDGYQIHHISILFGFSDVRKQVTDDMRNLISKYMNINNVENLIWLPTANATRIVGDMRISHGEAHHGSSLLVVYSRLKAGSDFSGQSGYISALRSVRRDMERGSRSRLGL